MQPVQLRRQAFLSFHCQQQASNIAIAVAKLVVSYEAAPCESNYYYYHYFVRSYGRKQVAAEQAEQGKGRR